MAITLGGTDKLISVSLPYVYNSCVTRHQDEEAVTGLGAHDGPNLGADFSLPTAPHAHWCQPERGYSIVSVVM